MKMKDNNYYAKLITTCLSAITLSLYVLDFVLIAILLANG